MYIFAKKIVFHIVSIFHNYLRAIKMYTPIGFIGPNWKKGSPYLL